MNKQFTNKELKNLIINLYNENNILLEDNLKIQLSQSSKITYIKLEKYYNEIKLKITDLLLLTISSRKISENDDNIIEKKDIDIQTNVINNNDIYTEIKELKTELFNQNQVVIKLKYKISNLKLEYKKNNKKAINDNSSSSLSEDDDNIVVEKRKYNYQELADLSSFNIINELSKLSKHQLKQLYNKYFSNKHNRQLA